MMNASKGAAPYSTLANDPGSPPPYGGNPQMQQPQGYGMPQPVMAQPVHSSTTVVITGSSAVQGLRDWQSGMCACFNDCGSCLMGWCCPLCLLCDVSSHMGEGCCMACCCPMTAAFGLRVKLRTLNNIQGSLMNDLCAVECCFLCAVCQMSRELKFTPRGQF